jgi:hypothetical protein
MAATLNRFYGRRYSTLVARTGISPRCNMGKSRLGSAVNGEARKLGGANGSSAPSKAI